MLCGSDVSVWRAGRDREWQWHIPRVILAQCSLSASIPSAIPGLGQGALHTDKVHNAHTVRYSNPTEPQAKETWCAHLLVIELYALPCVPTKEPYSV